MSGQVGRSRAVSSAGMVVISLVAVLAGLGASVAVVAGLATGVRAAASQLTSSKVTPAPARRTVTESMELLTNAAFGPRYTNASWSVQAGATVILKIKSYDDGTAPLTGAQMLYDNVEGTLGGTETVDGRAVRRIPNADVAHTFTVVGLGLNLPIPAAPTGSTVTVVARFVPERTGSFVWQCYAPCGTGPNLMGGPMATMSWMEGKVRVIQ